MYNQENELNESLGATSKSLRPKPKIISNEVVSTIVSQRTPNANSMTKTDKQSSNLTLTIDGEIVSNSSHAQSTQHHNQQNQNTVILEYSQPQVEQNRYQGQSLTTQQLTLNAANARNIAVLENNQPQLAHQQSNSGMYKRQDTT